MPTPPPTTPPTDAEVEAGHASFTPLTVRLYDAIVAVNCPVFWGCSRSALRAQYARNLAADHLDIGVGSGWLLDSCPKPVVAAAQRITLLDLNPHCLARAAHRLARYRVTTCRANALEPFPLPARSHGSAALSLMLHCVPGDLAYKAAALDHAAACVRPGGRLFGSTLLSLGVPVRPQTRLFLRMLNARGAMQNAADSLDELTAQLRARFPDYTVTVHGCTALFEATVPSRPRRPAALLTRRAGA